MKIVDKGVLDASFMEFSTPSEFARSALYYCPQFGHFYCKQGYDIQKEYLELYLLMYICSGTMTIEVNGKSVTAGSNQIVLIDCYQKHRYYCNGDTEFLWFHFNGNSCASYVKYLINQNGMVYLGEDFLRLKQVFLRIISEAQSNIGNEHRISLYVNQILCRMADSKQQVSAMNDLLLPALEHIRTEYTHPISLDDLADLCRISKPHLIRCFKKYLNCTPHEYLLSYRLKQSKQMLIGSQNTVEQIAELCGFNSASHFTRAFRGATGITPSEFRRLQF